LKAVIPAVTILLQTTNLGQGGIIVGLPPSIFPIPAIYILMLLVDDIIVLLLMQQQAFLIPAINQSPILEHLATAQLKELGWLK